MVKVKKNCVFSLQALFVCCVSKATTDQLSLDHCEKSGTYTIFTHKNTWKKFRQWLTCCLSPVNICPFKESCFCPVMSLTWNQFVCLSTKSSLFSRDQYSPIQLFLLQAVNVDTKEREREREIGGDYLIVIPVLLSLWCFRVWRGWGY